MAKSKKDRFDLFYSMYPRKISKKKAESAFLRLSHKEIDAIFACLPKHLESWNDKQKQFIPHPSTWLNGRRWEDSLEKKGEFFCIKTYKNKRCLAQPKQTFLNFKEFMVNLFK